MSTLSDWLGSLGTPSIHEKLRFYYITDEILPKGQIFTCKDNFSPLTLNLFHPDHLEELREAGAFIFEFVDFKEYVLSQDYQDSLLLKKGIDFLEVKK